MIFQLKRLFFQIVVFFSANLGLFNVKTGLCYPFFYCHACPTASAACPWRVIEQSVFKNNLNIRYLFYPMLILGFFGITTGRSVCGWACPIGLLQRVTARIARKFKTSPFFQKCGTHPIEPYLRYTKYIFLLGLVVITSAVIGFMFTDLCPIGFLTGTIPILIFNPGSFIGNQFFLPALVIFILFILLIFFIERGWCRYFCPVGAFLAPFNKISFLHISINKDECIHCNACSEVCPMGIDVPNMHRDPECILCGKCVTACPQHIISFERK